MSLALRRWWRLPAVQALLLLVAASLPAMGGAMLLARAGFSPSIYSAALLQGVFAALLCRWRRLALWWSAIVLLFPLALVGALALQLPPAVFLLAFVVLAGIYWSTFRTQVPYYPSSARIWAQVADLLPARPLRIADIGSGLGGLVLELARRRPDCEVFGVELAPLPWVVAWGRARLAGSRARFVRADYAGLDLGQCDVVFAYLSPAAMPDLWSQARGQMRPGSLLISLEFPIPGHAPAAVIAASGRDPALYLWNF